MNLYIYSDLLFGNNNNNNSNGPSLAPNSGDSTTNLLSYSKLLKESNNSRNHYFGGAQALPRKPLGIIRAAKHGSAQSIDSNSSKLNTTTTSSGSSSQSCSQQTQTYLVDLNLQSRDSLSFLNMSNLTAKSTNRSVSLNRRWNENTPSLVISGRNNESSSATSSSSRQPVEFIEGSKMTIGRKTSNDESTISLTPGQFRLRNLNNLRKNLNSPRHDTNSLTDSFVELRNTLKSSKSSKTSEISLEQK